MSTRAERGQLVADYIDMVIVEVCKLTEDPQWLDESACIMAALMIAHKGACAFRDDRKFDRKAKVGLADVMRFIDGVRERVDPD